MILLFILSIFGLFFVLTETAGPFNILSHIRNLLMRIPLLGPFFFKLIECPACLGFWSGITMSLLYDFYFDVNIHILNGFVGSCICVFGTKIIRMIDSINDKSSSL